MKSLPPRLQGSNNQKLHIYPAFSLLILDVNTLCSIVLYSFVFANNGVFLK